MIDFLLSPMNWLLTLAQGLVIAVVAQALSPRLGAWWGERSKAARDRRLLRSEAKQREVAILAADDNAILMREIRGRTRQIYFVALMSLAAAALALCFIMLVSTSQILVAEGTSIATAWASTKAILGAMVAGLLIVAAVSGFVAIGQMGRWRDDIQMATRAWELRQERRANQTKP